MSNDDYNFLPSCTSSGMAMYSNGTITTTGRVPQVSVGNSANLDMYDHIGQRGRVLMPLSNEVKLLEDRLIFYTKEYEDIRSQILNIRAILGMPRQPEGQDMKMSIALKELALELDKRADVFGNIDPMIKL